MPRLLMILATALLLWQPGVGTAAGPARSLDLRLGMSYAGVPVGKLRIQIALSGSQAKTQLDMESRGLAAMLTGYQGSATAQTHLAADGAPRSLRYDTFEETKRYNRKRVIRYDPATGGVLDVKSWKRGKLGQSKVPPQLWQGTTDPLTALLGMRHWLQAATKGGPRETALEVFDGGTRYTLRAELLEHTEVERGGRSLPVFHLKVRLVPIAGFNPRDTLGNWASEGEDRWIEVLLLDRAEPVPLLIRTRGGRLASTIELESLCTGSGGDDCVDYGS